MSILLQRTITIAATIIAICVLVSACASEGAKESDAALSSSTTQLASTTSQDAILTTTSRDTTPQPEETTTMPDVNPAPPLRCDNIADFSSDNANDQWVVVNDNVMGGRSLGDRTFIDGTMVFAGSINTNGGGFSSLRLPLVPGQLTEHDQIVFRARADARTYMVTFDDSLPGRSRRVSFRAPINFTKVDQWETVSVAFDDLFPAVFGNPVIDEPFRKDLATRMGIMLSDGFDGSFSLEVDSIEVCSAP